MFQRLCETGQSGIYVVHMHAFPNRLVFGASLDPTNVDFSVIDGLTEGTRKAGPIFGRQD